MGLTAGLDFDLPTMPGAHMDDAGNPDCGIMGLEPPLAEPCIDAPCQSSKASAELKFLSRRRPSHLNLRLALRRVRVSSVKLLLLRWR